MGASPTSGTGNGKGLFFEEALLVFEALDLNVEWYTKAAVAIQKATQFYCVIYDKNRRTTTQTSLDIFSNG